MSQPCKWCGTDFEPQGTGRSVKKFCSATCRRDFHTACRIWGEEQYGCGQVTIFQLRTCLSRRARRAQCDLAHRRPTTSRARTALQDDMADGTEVAV